MNFMRTSIYDHYSGPMKIATRLNDMSGCQTASGTVFSNRGIYRVFIINTRRDLIQVWDRETGANYQTLKKHSGKPSTTRPGPWNPNPDL